MGISSEKIVLDNMIRNLLNYTLRFLRELVKRKLQEGSRKDSTRHLGVSSIPRLGYLWERRLLRTEAI